MSQPCLFCGHPGFVASGFDLGKHEESCQLWKSCQPERCAFAHTPFLRGSKGPKGARVYEYECNFCNKKPEFRSEITGFVHPLCVYGIHYWTMCGDSCCGPYCYGCGKTGRWEDYRDQIAREKR